jgi:hypothetical protein
MEKISQSPEGMPMAEDFFEMTINWLCDNHLKGLYDINGLVSSIDILSLPGQ